MATDTTKLRVELEATTAKFVAAMRSAQKQGTITATELDKVLARANGAVAKSARKAQFGMLGMIKVSRQGRFVLQNTANNIGDVAIQLESGTDAMRVMGQQIPQILGGFGALRGVLGLVAPILGTIAALGFPLVAMMASTGDASTEAAGKVETYADKLKVLEGAIADYQDAVTQATLPTDELIKKYGTATAAAREFIAALQEANRVKSAEALKELVSNLVSSFETLDAVAGAGARAGVTDLDAQVAALAEKFEITKEAAANLHAAIGVLSEAKGPREVVDAAQALREILSDTLGPYDEMNEAQQELYDQLVRAGEEAADLVGTIEEAARASGNLVSAAYEAAQGFASALPIVDDLLGRVSALAAAAWDYAGAMGRAAQLESIRKRGGGRGGDPRAQGGSAYDWQNREATAWLENYKPPKAPRRGGGGGRRRSGGRGGSRARPKPDLFADAQKELTAISRKIEMIGKEKHEITALQAKYKLLDEAKKRGLDLDKESAKTGETLRAQIDRQSEAIGDLTAKYEQAEARADFFRQVQEDVKDGILDAIVEGENLVGVLENIAKAFARAALEAALFGTGPLSGSGGGGIGNIISGLFPGASSKTAAANVPVAVISKAGASKIAAPAATSKTALNVVVKGAPSEPNVSLSPDGQSLELDFERKVLSTVTGANGRRALNHAFGLRAKPQGR